jgi:3-deoxy-D-manno-octulosonate 8-phosphate phosphatase (KDO 8-P phosphatase)
MATRATRQAAPAAAPGARGVLALRRRAAAVRLVALDVDGVLTDGRLYFGARGDAMKSFHVRDGQGIRMLQQAGIELALITGRSSGIVAARARDLDIRHVLQGQRDKHAALRRVLAGAGLGFEACAYMGDDWPDLAVLGAVGLAATVADAPEEVRGSVHWVAPSPGGGGAVRDLAGLILRAQGRFDSMLLAQRRVGAPRAAGRAAKAGAAKAGMTKAGMTHG